MRNAAALVVITASLMLIMCANQGKRIIGKWENKESLATYEFRSDGKYRFTGTGHVIGLFGPYKVQKKQLYMTAKMPNDYGQWENRTTVYDFSVEGDTLILNGVRYDRISE